VAVERVPCFPRRPPYPPRAGIYLLTCVVLRRPLGSAVPWLVVAVLELADETSDFVRYYVSAWPWTATNTVEDIVNTLFWPSVLVMMFHRQRLAAAIRIAPPE
jgi:hypothetical protein